MYISPKHAQFMRIVGYFLILIGNKLIQLYTPPVQAERIVIRVEHERCYFPSWLHREMTIEVKSCSHS